MSVFEIFSSRKKDINNVHLEESDHAKHGLKRTLTVVDLTAFGVGSIVGAGIFSTVGAASYSGGPGVVFLFFFSAFACGISALCYAQFASMIPLAGSAYTYAYYVFGELAAWTIGWTLILEYCLSNIVIAISWSDYFTGILSNFNIHFPTYLSMGYENARTAVTNMAELISKGLTVEQIATNQEYESTYIGYQTYLQAPTLFGIKCIVDLPALFISCLVTLIAYVGIKESSRTTNVIVLVKLCVIAIVVGCGAFYISAENWNPFIPNGFAGIMKGTAAVFFAYVGFDAISTTAEECRNPQRDLPRSMIYSVIITTFLYIIITIVLTGVVSYKFLNVGDPILLIFDKNALNMPWLSTIVGVSVILTMITANLTYQVAQPRIWYSMSKDGLLPRVFSTIHEKFRTPSFATIVAGFAVGIPSMIMDIHEATDMVSIGTLFAFLLVSFGIIILHHKKNAGTISYSSKFEVPYVNGKYLTPLTLLIFIIVIQIFLPDFFSEFFSMTSDVKKSVVEILGQKFSMGIFMICAVTMVIYSYLKSLSFIPTISVITNLFLLSELGMANWVRLFVWLLIGLVIYFFYSRKKSVMGKKESPESRLK